MTMRAGLPAMASAAALGRVSAGALGLLLAGALPATAQRVSTAVVPETITVGDVFHAAVRVELPPGAEVQFPDTLAVPAGDVEAVGRVRVQTDSSAAGPVRTAVYPLTAWRAGRELRLPDLQVAVRRADGTTVTLSAAFPDFTLRSVLPADTAGIEPKPAKDVWGANRVWWPLLLAAALVLLLVALAWYLWRRRRPRLAEAAPVPAVPPRAAALERLERAREARFIERGELKPFYTELSAALRTYLEAIDAELGADLTTGELALHARRRGAPPALLELVRLLGRADLVKFARAYPAAAEAYADLDDARRWVEQHDGATIRPSAAELAA